MLLEIIQFLVFPGLLFIFLMSFISVWLLRKLTARLENRVGPPFAQPIFDFTKLLAKERLYPQGSERVLIRYMPKIQVIIAVLMAFFIPFVGNEGLISFDGDLYVFIFLLALHGVSTYFVGWASRNPYALSGAGRAVMTEISLEIPLSIALAGMSIMTGSIRISEISKGVFAQMNPNLSTTAAIPSIAWIYIIPWFVFFIISIYCCVGALEYNPFSAAHAETEIVAGWSTELTGADYAHAKLADYINLFNLAGILAAIFLGGPWILNFSEGFYHLSLFFGFVVMMIKIGFIIFLFSILATLSSRMKIDQITNDLWSWFLPISMIGMFMVLVIQFRGVS
jgi:NADH-quinone oxidoreductase subunit H